GKLWGFSKTKSKGDRPVLYTVDLATGAATVKKIFPAMPGPAGGFEFGPDDTPDEDAAFVLSGTQLYKLDIDAGTFALLADVGFTGGTLALPGRCVDFFSADENTGMLMRIRSTDGAASAVGQMNIGTPVNALAAAPTGVLYVPSAGNLYALDGTSGEATLIGPIGYTPAALAFKSPYSKTFCLDKGLKSNRLSQYVVQVNSKVQHVVDCPKPPPPCQKPTCKPQD